LDALGFGFSNGLAEGGIIGYFDQDLQVLKIVELPVVAGGEDPQLTGKEQPLGMRVDIGTPENGDAARGYILFVQEFEKNLAETPAADNRDVETQQIFDHGEPTNPSGRALKASVVLTQRPISKKF
jgi:hypothetical protein